MGYQPLERKHKRSSMPKEEHPMQEEWDRIAEEQWKRSDMKRAGDALITVFGQMAVYIPKSDPEIIRELYE